MRQFKTAFPQEFLAAYHPGTMNYTYRGVPCLKSPIDLALYMKLIFERRPASIVEIGSFKGGSALFLADISTAYGLSTRIVSFDRYPVEGIADPRVQFVIGDVEKLLQSPLDTIVAELQRPWLVIDDSAHTSETCRAVLDYFTPRLVAGDVLVIEDGVLDDLGWSDRFNGGPNRALREFFAVNPGAFRVMTEYTDFFGQNATYSPNAWLEKR